MYAAVICVAAASPPAVETLTFLLAIVTFGTGVSFTDIVDFSLSPAHINKGMAGAPESRSQDEASSPAGTRSNHAWGRCLYLLPVIKATENSPVAQ